MTLEQVSEIVQRAINPIAAQIRRLGQPTTEPKPTATTPAAEASIAERLRAIEAREAKAADRARTNGMKSAAMSAGVPAGRVDVLVPYLLNRDGERIRLADDGETVQAFDEYEQSHPITDYLRTFLASPEGEMFRPPVQTPAGRGLRGGQTPVMGRVPYHELPDETRQKMTPQERAAYVREEVQTGP